ncbi:ParB-like nuclease domain containing protein [Methanonatronarchaeum thermophilum]|uniref:ParB-like nuclease domain containing protein n=1 Tax=Methanonatronarchaeum thermophilum TaxID=1927129 RepID=A0A1Y3GIR2_9EURY|nr:hypothetical protein [Methanonatronarchaeum thermophilum]OUJ19286.1 ParB-like nuclease domain containing protein [Methanonatronarchaeum thermophilum]
MIIVRPIGLYKIPVRVMVRHRKLVELRKEIAKAQKIEKISYKPKRHLNHPDMKDINKQFI